MPIYLITDKRAPHRVMVEAARPQTALAALIADRFELSAALDAGDALRLARKGVEFLETGEASPTPDPEPNPEPQILQGGGVIRFDAEGKPIEGDGKSLFQRMSDIARGNGDNDGNEDSDIDQPRIHGAASANDDDFVPMDDADDVIDDPEIDQ